MIEIPPARIPEKLSEVIPHAEHCVGKSGNDIVNSMSSNTKINAEEFLDHSIQFCDAAQRLIKGKPFIFKPTFYCAIHSIELALKGHLVLSGFTASNLRNREYGHNISRLLDKAIVDEAVDEKVVDFFDQQAIKWGSEDYAGKCFEYPETMYSTYPIGKWTLIAEKLIFNLEEKLISMQT